jgi:signal transduction histidine kinase/DNA-binding response OmpR family regulator
VPRSDAAERVAALVDELLAAGESREGALRQAIEGLDAGERVLAERLAALALERASWQRGIVQTAKLAEVGMSMAELVHELRQPLSGIAGFAQLLSADPHAKDVPGWSKEILSQTSRMEQMLERMRRFVRAPEQQAVGPIEPAAAIKEAVALFPKLPPGVRVELQVAPSLPQILGEHGPLVQVLTNLIGNARDATEPEPGLILVKAAALSSGGVEIVVADQGSGLSKEIAERLFEPFATSKGERGTGLGLYICRQILEAWDGEIALSEPPASFKTAFRVVLRPASKPARARDEEGLAKSRRAVSQLVAEMSERLCRQPSERRILIVDDEPAVRRALKVLLATEPGLEILEAADGPAALALLSRHPVQLVVADKSLPGMSGLELLRRALERELACESLVVTGYPTPQAVLEAVEARACDFFVKPVSQVEQLRARVAEALERARWRQLSRGLGGDLRLWAERLLQVLPPAGDPDQPELRPVLETLAARPEGPGRVLVVEAAGLVERLALAGHQANGSVAADAAVPLLAEESFDALVIGRDVRHAEALALARDARAMSPATRVIWGTPIPSFDQALEVLRAGAFSILELPIEQETLESLLARAVRASREEARLIALEQSFELLGLSPSPASEASGERGCRG